MLNENIRNLRKAKGLSQEELDTSVSVLLGETVREECLNQGDLKSIYCFCSCE